MFFLSFDILRSPTENGGCVSVTQRAVARVTQQSSNAQTARPFAGAARMIVVYTKRPYCTCGLFADCTSPVLALQHSVILLRSEVVFRPKSILPAAVWVAGRGVDCSDPIGVGRTPRLCSCSRTRPTSPGTTTKDAKILSRKLVPANTVRLRSLLSTQAMTTRAGS